MAKEPEAKAVDVEAEAKAEGFVKMVKAEVVSFVNAACVDAHKAVGWIVAEWRSL